MAHITARTHTFGKAELSPGVTAVLEGKMSKKGNRANAQKKMQCKGF